MIDTTLPIGLALADFGEPVILDDGSSAGRQILGLYDDHPGDSDYLSGSPDARQVLLTCRADDIRDISMRDRVTLASGAEFLIIDRRDIHPGGFAVLTLQPESP